MKTFMERFDDYWSGGPPVVRNLFLVRSVYPMLIFTSTYVLFVKIVGPYVMKNRKPVQMRPLIIVYNFWLVIFYVWYLLKGISFIPRMGLQMFCGSLLNNDKYGEDIIKELFFHVYYINIIKYVEFIDTVFLVLSKKPATSLHVFHHAILPVFSWFGLRSETGGYLGMFIGVNCLVHIIMYAYFGIAALGPKYQKYIWWKKYLTSLQILQFLVMTIYMSFMYAFGCCTSRFIFYLCIFLSVLFFFLFTNFYIGAFNDTEKKKKSQKNGFQQTSKQNGINGCNGVPENDGSPLMYKNDGSPLTNTNGGSPLTYKNDLKKKDG
ncbi:hypothetical protein JTE90_000586 [Oedothorax gibbosus]|uniref:Elongation of very long chain fatty acids protein n=1 Tax=Oedothorax gibbosus TaxID=931172 RepID=A0AAV6VV29_9ARAC|nr:hypothetical protein JTE90_000586 [Oedothorax gibbosus]